MGYTWPRGTGVAMERHRLGELIRARRNAKGLSLRDAAALGSVAHATWGHIEKGVLNTTIDTLAEIARVLGAHWEIRLDGGLETLDPTRTELLDRLGAIVDQLSDRDVRLLLMQVAAYEDELPADLRRGSHGDSSK